MTSFEFTWGGNKNPTGTAFARKRKVTKQNPANASKPVAVDKNASNPTEEVNLRSERDKQSKQKIFKRRPHVQDNQKASNGSEQATSARSKTYKETALTGRPDTEITFSNVSKNANDTTERSFGYVKRKQRKDKLANAAQADGGEGNKMTTKAATSTSHSLFSVRPKDIYVNANIPGKSVVERVFSAGKKFSDLEIHRHLVSNLEKHAFTKLTTVQAKSIPEVMAGKNVLVRSQTGSGKTLAYSVPIIDALQSISPRLTRQDGVQALIVVPTRELALQTHELLSKINTFQWIVVGHLCGGENRNTEKNRLRKGVHVLVATPGRLLDHVLHTNAFKLNSVRCLVLDEADRLLDMGFKKDVMRIVEELDNAKVNAGYDPMALLKGTQLSEDEGVDTDTDTDCVFPLRDPSSKTRQTLLLSATLNQGLAELADFTMKDHVYVDALDNASNPKHMVIPDTVTQEFIVTHVKHRLFTLSAVLLAKSKRKVFVFMATGQMVDYHYDLFTRYLTKMPRNRGMLKVEDVLEDLEDGDDDVEEVVLESEFFKLHGSMDQAARKEVFGAFRAAKRGILLCTDVAARGVDVPEADCIIQYTGPQSDDDYLHRVGRTGRAGKSGSALIFLTHEEQAYITRLQEHKVFLKEHQSDDFLKHLCTAMEEPEQERAATALQRRYELALEQDKELHRAACFAYSSWSRFYNTYPGPMRSIFNFKNVNLGHYVTSFALKDTPSNVGRIVRGQVVTVKPRRLNQKLSTRRDDDDGPVKTTKRKIKSVSLTTSEFGSGLEPSKKKRKLKNKN